MSNEQSVRDAAAEWIAGLISGNGFGDDYVDDEVKQWADDLLSSPVIRRIQAEALREAAEVAEDWAANDGMNGGEWMPSVWGSQAKGWLRHRADRIEQNSEGNET